MNKDKIQIGDLVIDRQELYRQDGVGLVCGRAFRKPVLDDDFCEVYFFKSGETYKYAKRNLILLRKQEAK